MRKGNITGLVLIAVLSLTACAAPGSDPDVAQYPQVSNVDRLFCGDSAIPRGVVDDVRPASQLNAATIAGIEHSEFFGSSSLEDWFIGTESDSSVVLLRRLETPEKLSHADIRDHEMLRFTADQPAAIASDTSWSLAASTSCALRIDLGGLGPGGVTLDPDRLPMPDDTTLHLLVTEQACNSGKDAAGRVEVAGLHETVATVEIVVGIQPGQNGTCPSNPPTPFVVELSAPLGDRQLLDAAVSPARELASR